ncbi:Uncharacterised protein [uncultured archaeon]|nr:Uncharacterised protein [uncultured archaeon]
MAIIYFDQWVYVTLLRSYKGSSPEYPKYAKICQGLIESSNDRTNKFPLSLSHLHETLKRNKLSSRKELFKFMFDLSKFSTIRPWTQVIDLEVRNAVLKSLGLKTENLSDFVFGDELVHCIGGIQEFESIDPNKKVPDEIKEKIILDVFRNSELISDAFSKVKSIEHVDSFIQKNNELTQKLEVLRKKDYSNPDKKMRKNISDVRFFIEIIMDPIIKAATEFTFDSQKYTQQILSSRESTINFLKLIPTAYVFHILNEARNLNSSRPIEPNDFWDIATLAISVPYCDVVVTEREWANILNKNKIGELYNTKILHKIENLSEFI